MKLREERSKNPQDENLICEVAVLHLDFSSLIPRIFLMKGSRKEKLKLTNIIIKGCRKNILIKIIASKQRQKVERERQRQKHQAQSLS